ncbi:RNA polymerase sigma factor [Rhizobium sp. SAFR-030]|uniref:RNA polymerase sigma factor n=1 Tax=Rhizobium sp. SAFR-030 TaxID=3387277 RepID=UPI003F7DF609
MNHPDDQSFEGQVLALLPALRRYARSLARSDTEGEDLLQDSLEAALKQRRQWRGLNLRGWLLSIVTNHYRNGVRTRSRHPSVDLAEAAHVATQDPVSDPLQRTRLLAALDNLPAEQRAVLMLVVVEGCSYAEAAGLLDLPIGTVMSRLARARLKVGDYMKAENIVPLRRPT